MSRYSRLVAKPIPQTEPLNEKQVKNNAGGFVFQLDKFKRLERFLILGSDSNTYYQKAVALTRENAKVVTECFTENPVKTIDAIVSVSVEGRAPKNDPAIFALALGAVHTDLKTRQMARSAMPAVCRTATHLFQFVTNVRTLGGGWGRGLKNAVAKWYNDKSADDAAYQIIKYRQRDGWSQKDMLTTAHPDAGKDEARKALYQWTRGVAHNGARLPAIIPVYEAVSALDTSKERRIGLMANSNLPWEALPTECLADADYWAAMLPKMPLHALVRNLGNMSRLGLTKPLSASEKLIVERLSDVNAIRKSRLHPFNILLALKTYESGQGFRGTNKWDASQKVVSALDKAFYKAFKNVQPTGKRYLYGLDVSGSMSSPFGGTNVSCCMATAALSLVALNTEPQVHVMGFAGPGNFMDLKLREDDTLDAAMRKTHQHNFGSTDCSGAMLYALNKSIAVDTFVIMTDNETYAGREHVSVTLQRYRKAMGINAKLIVVGMTATGFSIADPTDPGMLDIVGFSADGPAIIADFSRH